MIEKFSEIALVISVLGNLSGNGLDVSDVQREQLHCLAHNIYHESKGEGEYGKLAVANVTLNRVASDRYPDTICEVVYEKKRSARTGRYVAMFSWTQDGKPDDIRLTNSKGQVYVHNYNVWIDSITIGALAMTGLAKDITCGSTHFYAHNLVTPVWANSPKFEPACNIPGGVVGGHTFLKASGE